MKSLLLFPLACLVLGVAAPASAADVPVSGTRATLKGGADNAKKREVIIELKDPAITAPFADPKDGATLRISTTPGDGRCSVEIPLDGKHWSALGRLGKKGFRYKGKPKRTQGIQLVKIKSGKITIRGGGKHWPCDLGADSQPLPLRVELRLGGESGTLYCAAFGGTVKANKKGRFAAKAAGAPETCIAPSLAQEP